MRSLGLFKRLVTSVAAIGLLIGNSGIANADNRTINFEPPAYTPTSIQGQQGWGGQNPPGIPINPLIDQTVVLNGTSAPPSFGRQSWRISNAFTEGSFGDMPFSPSLVNEAGETDASNMSGVFQMSGGVRQNHFEVQWQFASADPGPGTDCSAAGVTCSYVSMAPDRGDGARMSYIRLEDDTTGLRVFFDDYQDKSPYGSLQFPAKGCGPEDNWVETLVASGLDRAQAHTVKLSMDFKDGPRNDIVKVYVDGDLVHTGTSWEDYFRWCTESGGGIPMDSAHDRSRTVDSMIFTVRGGDGETHPLNRGKGFLIDNLSYTSSMRPTCEHHGDGDGDVEDGHGGHGHASLHKSGCDKSSSDSVRHDDDQSGHHFQSSSVNSSEYSTTASGGRSITMVGIGTDNGLPVGFTMVAVDNDGLLSATYSIILTNGYSFVGTFLTGSVVSIQ